MKKPKNITIDDFVDADRLKRDLEMYKDQFLNLFNKMPKEYKKLFCEYVKDKEGKNTEIANKVVEYAKKDPLGKEALRTWALIRTSCVSYLSGYSTSDEEIK